MKELYAAPQMEIVTFVPVEQLAAGYLEGYARTIGAVDPAAQAEGGGSDVDVSIDNGEGTP